MSKRYVSGLDLGQLQDYTALVVLEGEDGPDPDFAGREVPYWSVRHIYRWPLRTPYPRIVEGLAARFANPPLRDTPLVVDRTGVGVAVVDMLRDARLPVELRPYQITAGSKPGDGTVPKLDLVASVQAALGQERIKFSKHLDQTPTLTAELKAFQVKVTADRNETFAAWRERDHDDLVLALALAVWFGERYPPAEITRYSGRTPYDDAPYLFK